jgi:site-specific recombinase XerD
MKSAKIAGPHATPKGLRHGFGINAVTCGVPLNTLQQLFGHAPLSTTSIYADAMGPEKRQLVERMWR